MCSECGYVVACPNCTITLTLHRTPERLLCHYCLSPGGAQPGLSPLRWPHSPPARAWHAAGRAASVGPFPGRVNRAHGRRHDERKMGARRDSRSRGQRGSRHPARHADDREGPRFSERHARRSHRRRRRHQPSGFPRVRAMFSAAGQVAGRAGRGPKGGRVLIQTRVPDHHAVACAVAHDYARFVREEMPGRIKPPYPPNVRLANIVFSGTAEPPVADLAIAAGVWLRELIATRGLDEVTVIGPAPCPIERIKTRWRWHLLLKSEQAGDLTRVSRYFMEKFPVPGKSPRHARSRSGGAAVERQGIFRSVASHRSREHQIQSARRAGRKVRRGAGRRRAA